VLCEVLRAGGFSPVGAFGGQQALEEVARARPDLILLDLMMPHVSGFDVLEALRGQADTADLPIVVLTAKLMSPREHDALRARVQHIMDKADFLPASLLAELSRALSKVRHANHQWSSRRVVGAA
jgi:CheY-like chemotaxis protein